MSVFSLRRCLNMNSNKISNDMPQKLQRQRGPLRRKCEPVCHSIINFTSLAGARGLSQNDLRQENSFPLTYHPWQWIIIPASPPES